MEESNKTLLSNCLKKFFEALDDAKFNFEGQIFKVTLNRIYYSIFYSVMALGYKDNFVTSKHKQLMGWFNKRYIHDEKIFEEKLIMVYQRSYNSRQEADYEISDISNISKAEIESALNDAEFFISKIKTYLDSEIKH